MKKLSVLHVVSIINILIAFMISGITGGKWHLKALRPYYPFMKLISLFLIVLTLIYVIIILFINFKNRKNPKTYNWTKTTTMIVCIWVALELSIVSFGAGSIAKKLNEFTTYSFHETAVYNDVEFKIENYKMYEEESSHYVTFYIYMKNHSEKDFTYNFLNWELDAKKAGKNTGVTHLFDKTKTSMLDYCTLYANTEDTKTVTFEIEEGVDEMRLGFLANIVSTNPVFVFKI